MYAFCDFEIVFLQKKFIDFLNFAFVVSDLHISVFIESSHVLSLDVRWLCVVILVFTQKLSYTVFKIAVFLIRFSVVSSLILNNNWFHHISNTFSVAQLFLNGYTDEHVIYF